MSLTQWQYDRRRRLGPAKRHEQVSDYSAMTEAAARVAEAWGDVDEARRLRESVRPQPMTSKVAEPEPQVAPKTKPRKRSRKSKASPPSKLTARQASDLAWNELRRRRER